MNERQSLWDGMTDGDDASVEFPFGELVFSKVGADPSVGIHGGLVFKALEVRGKTWEADKLPTDLVTALEDWASEQ